MNIQLSKVYGDDACYVKADSAAAIESLPEAAWQKLVDALENETGQTEPGVDCAVAVTHEDIEDFCKASYCWNDTRESQRISESVVVFRGVQVKKGDRRIDAIIVVDCGDLRAVMTY